MCIFDALLEVYEPRSWKKKSAADPSPMCG